MRASFPPGASKYDRDDGPFQMNPKRPQPSKVGYGNMPPWTCKGPPMGALCGCISILIGGGMLCCMFKIHWPCGSTRGEMGQDCGQVWKNGGGGDPAFFQPHRCFLQRGFRMRMPPSFPTKTPKSGHGLLSNGKDFQSSGHAKGPRWRPFAAAFRFYWRGYVVLHA